MMDDFFKMLLSRPGLWHLLDNIFSHVDTDTLLHCDQVCQTFEDILVTNEILLKSIDLNSYEGHLFKAEHSSVGTNYERHQRAKAFLSGLTKESIEARWKRWDRRYPKVHQLKDCPVSHAIVPQWDNNRILLTLGPELWLADRTSLDRQMAFVGHRLDISCLDVSGRYAVTGSKDRQVIIWDLELACVPAVTPPSQPGAGTSTRKRLACLDNVHERLVTGVKFVTDSSATIRYIVTTSRDRTIKIWSVSGLGTAQTQVLLDQTVAAGEGRNSVNHIKSIWGVDVKWPYIGTASADNTLKAWKFNEADCKFITPSKEPKFKHVRDAKKVKKNAANIQGSDVVSFYCTFHNGAPIRHCLLLSKTSGGSNEQFMVSGDILGDLHVWNLQTETLQYQVHDPYDAATMFRLSGAVASLSHHDGHLAIWYMNRGVAIYDTTDIERGMRGLGLVKSSEFSTHHKSLTLTKTDLYVAHAGGLFSLNLVTSPDACQT